MTISCVRKTDPANNCRVKTIYICIEDTAVADQLFALTTRSDKTNQQLKYSKCHWPDHPHHSTHSANNHKLDEFWMNAKMVDHTVVCHFQNDLTSFAYKCALVTKYTIRERSSYNSIAILMNVCRMVWYSSIEIGIRSVSNAEQKSFFKLIEIGLDLIARECWSHQVNLYGAINYYTTNNKKWYLISITAPHDSSAPSNSSSFILIEFP